MDALALRLGGRLDDEQSLLGVLLEQRDVLGNDVGHRHEVEVALTVRRLHLGDVPVHAVLASQLVRTREVVHLLVRPQVLVNLA